MNPRHRPGNSQAEHPVHGQIRLHQHRPIASKHKLFGIEPEGGPRTLRPLQSQQIPRAVSRSTTVGSDRKQAANRGAAASHNELLIHFDRIQGRLQFQTPLMGLEIA